MCTFSRLPGLIMSYRFLFSKNLQQGMTLVEVLVAIALGLLVIAGIGQIYTAAKRSYDIQTNMSRMQDAGRYAIDTLTRDIQLAGYWGLTDMRAVVNNNPNWIPLNGIPYAAATYATCPNDNTWGRMVLWRVFGLNDVGGANGSTYACISSAWARGDVLVVRYADPAPLSPCSQPDTRLHIRTYPYDGWLSLANPDCPGPGVPGTTAHRVVAHAYYVQKNSAAQCDNATIPSLAREELTDNGLPQKNDLIVGVENLQFQYGIDSDGDGSVNQYLNGHQLNGPPIAPHWNQVVSIRVWVLVRSDCPDLTFNPENKTTVFTLGDNPYTVSDHFRRQLYSTTVTLRN